MISAWPQPALADFSPGEELRPVVAGLRARRQAGEAVYVYAETCPAFRYYDRAGELSAVCGSTGEPIPNGVRALAPAGPAWAVFTRCVEPACRAQLDQLRAEWRVTETLSGGPEAFALRLERP
jgi:hypothetical protein